MRSGRLTGGVKQLGFGMSKELPFLPTTTRRVVCVSDIVALPFLHSKSISRQKEELWKSSRRNQNPSRYHNSMITIYLKLCFNTSQNIIFQKSSYV
jgi:hypothetical protein